MKKWMLLLVWVSLAVSICQAQVYQRSELLLDSVGVTGVSAAIDVGRESPFRHTVQVVITGSPATCTVALEGSLDIGTSPSNWFSLSGDQTCTASIMFHVADRPIRQIRANLSALTGGSSPTVTVRYLGTR